MLDWLAIWGVGQATVFVFRPVMEEFAMDVANDAAKSYVGRGFQKVFSPPHRQPLTKATGLALKELLELIQNEMLDADMSKGDLHAWLDDVRRFVGQDAVLAAIRELFLTPGATLDPGTLAAAWQGPETPRLPDTFSWARVAKRFARKVDDIRTSITELKETFDALAAAQGDDALRELAGLPPEFDLETYREALIERYGNVSFDSLDTSGASYNAVRLWSVFTPQSARTTQEYMPQLFELPKEQQQRLVERGELDATLQAEAERLEDEWRRGYFSQPLRPVLEVCADTSLPLIVVLGDPGAGKSSLLRWLALEWARTENATARYAAPLPLLIELRDYNRWECASGKGFVRYLHDSSTWHRLNQQTLHHLLQQPGRVLLLLDGLDEVFDPVQRERVVNDIHRFSNEYKATRMIVTSRVVGYQPQRLRDAGFKDFMLQDLDSAQIEQFLERWHRVTFSDAHDARQKLDRMHKAIRDSRAIAQLAGNPLLLTMMAILNRQQDLPRARAELYKRAAHLLLHQWDTARALSDYPELSKEINEDSKQEILRLVARSIQMSASSDGGSFIDDKQLKTEVEKYLLEQLYFSQARAAAQALVRHLRERNFILCFVGGNSYAFVHRTFLEYFCAADIVQRFNVERSLDLDSLKHIFMSHSQDETWKEILRLVCGQIGENFVVELIDCIIEKIAINQWDGKTPISEISLCLYCLSELKRFEKSEKTAKSLLDLTLEITSHSLDDKKFIKWFLDEILPPYQIIGFKWPDKEYFHKIIINELKCNNISINTQTLFIKLISAIYSDCELVQTIACSNEYTTLARIAAFEELVLYWPGERARELLEDYVSGSRNNDFNLRSGLIRILGEHWQDNRTQGLLAGLSCYDASLRIRCTSLLVLDKYQFISSYKSSIEEIVESIYNLHICNDNIGSSIKLWDNPLRRDLLELIIKYSNYSAVRLMAVEELANDWKDERLRDILENYGLKDKYISVCIISIEAISALWHDNITFELLIEYANMYASADIRNAALNAMVRHWQDKQTREILEQRAVIDVDPTVRRTALLALKEHWPDKKTQTLLKKQSRMDEVAAFVMAYNYSDLGRIVFTKSLDSALPYLDPRQPIPRAHIEVAAAQVGIAPADIDAEVRGLSAHMGWDITQGSGAV